MTACTVRLIRCLIPMVIIGYLLCGSSALGTEVFTNSLGMRFVLIPAGDFVMGSPRDETGRHWNETPHRVVISNSFYLGETEVTQGQWNRLVSPNPSSFKLGDQYPVDSVTWHEAQQFITFLNQHENTNRYRLPTEAEWEYACRAGSTTAFATGRITTLSCSQPEPDLIHHAWYCYNSGSANPPGEFRPHPVRTRLPNAWGLYDMHGNVQEWVMDSCRSHNFWRTRTGAVTDTYTDNIVDPLETRGDHRIIRGGGWFQNSRYQRCAYRGYYRPIAVRNSLGFRIARTQ